ncbi:pantetheine-phosphate adenylyltransferase [Flaviflexus salsibiostraticola]|uniref:Phosphopantetheine adenylyltransferase n=1 Tax=Flaviflexus salsibiostraticola TaxID=1282737 RepID=A0A3Q8WTE6_9ACTO|nr:pantetheine-phosphate adenylyltransferase [Flaviflexus salsibiostraticola]AZN29579.1 pantetheine-phosphate adenylyltransferase [Flaviflexus salsibiostraticola]
MSIAVCPGSFDPITLGHVDVVRRALTMFDQVIVGVAQNADKRYLFSPAERLALARASVADLPGASAEPITGLLADYVKSIGASAIVKGLRGSADYDNEHSMALLNRHLSGVETIFIMGDSGLGHIASSLVKDVASHGGRIDDLVPVPVAQALTRKDRND